MIEDDSGEDQDDFDAIHYDPDIIQKVAVRRYRHAFCIILLWTLPGLFAGGYAGHFLSPYTNDVMVIGTCVGGLLGCAMGYERALRFKFEAQLALCQVKIEEHTRQLAARGTAKRLPAKPSSDPSRSATRKPVEPDDNTFHWAKRQPIDPDAAK